MWNPSRSLKLGFLIYKTEGVLSALALLWSPCPLPFPQSIWSVFPPHSAILSGPMPTVCVPCVLWSSRDCGPSASLCLWSFPSKEYWSSCHFLLRGMRPHPGIKPILHWQVDSLPLRRWEAPWPVGHLLFVGIMLSTWQVFAFIFLHKKLPKIWCYHHLMIDDQLAVWESYVKV